MYVSKRLPKCKTVGCDKVSVNRFGHCLSCTDVSNPIESFYHDNGYKTPIGVEIECFVSYDDVSKLDKSFVRHGDGSIRMEPGTLDVEAKFCNDSTKIQKESIDACNYIGTMRGAGVNHSCGLHVHVGGIPKVNTYMDDSSVVVGNSSKLYNVFKPLQSKMRSIFGYRLNRARYICELHSTMAKGCWVSYRPSFNTVEIRVHESTLNPQIMHDWLSACFSLQKLAKDAMEGKKTSRVKSALSGDLFGTLRKNSPGERYLRKRMEFMSKKSDPHAYSNFTEFERLYS